jgi:signal transduction histidine kinase
MSFISSITSDPRLLEQIVFYGLLSMIAVMAVLLVIYATRSERFERLYENTNKEARLLARLKNVYEAELKTFANLMDEITFPIWQRDKNLNIIYCNSRFCEVTGDIRENIIKSGKVELYRDGREFAARAIKTGQVQMMEQNIVVAGSNMLNQVVEIPISDKTSAFGAKNGTIGFALNLAELQNTRERLKFTLELQKRLLESLNSAVAIYGFNQKLEYYNRAFVDLWKLDEDWLKTYPTYGEILEALREKRKLPEQADFASFKRENIGMFNNLISKKEDYYYLADGKVLKVIIIPYQSRGLLFYYEDMTTQLSLERSYNTMVSVQRHTLDNLNESVVVFGEDGKLELFNPNFMNLWGFTESFLKSEPHISRVLDEMVSLYTLDNAKLFKEDFISTLSHREFLERKMVRNDGMIMIERFTPLPDGATLITYFDITDKENVERSLRAEKKAYEEADKIKTNFLGSVSYEFRSPLTSIMGFSELMLALYSPKMDAKSQGYMKAIHESSIKLKNLIDNIIDVSTIDAGYVVLNNHRADVFDVVTPVVNELKAEGSKRGITINAHIDKNVSHLVVDKPRLQQALRSIVICSLAMSKAKDTIEIEISKNDDNIHFEITDHGAGIAPNDLPIIFDHFYKIQAGGDLQASGLSLYLAKKIIEMHHGFIHVESELGKGTKFIFEIPSYA